MLTWHYITKAAYDAADASLKTADKLFFISDTKQIFRGTQNFTESVELYTGTLPATPALQKLYINSTTLEGKIYNGSAWQTVIQPVVTGNTGDELDGTNTTRPVSGKAVADYVESTLGDNSEILSDLDYNSSTKVITGTMLDGTTTDTITLEGLGCNLTFEAIDGSTTQKALKLKDISGNVLATVNLDLERFVTDASYDANTKTIILAFDNEDPHVDVITIPVGDLVDTYTVGDTATVDMSMDSNNKITASVKLSANANNAITAQADGLHVDISGKADKVASATANDIATLDANGNLLDSGKKAGGATITYDEHDAASADTLATEAAVEAIRAALQANIDGKMAKLASGNADEVLLSTADGEAARSGKTLGGNTFAATASQATTMATEAGVVNYAASTFLAKADLVDTSTVHTSSAAASDVDPISEKAVLAALEWKTTV